MDGRDSFPDAEDHTVQDIQRFDMGGNCEIDGEEVYRGGIANGIQQIYERKLKFVRFVRTFRFQIAIV